MTLAAMADSGLTNQVAPHIAHTSKQLADVATSELESRMERRMRSQYSEAGLYQA